MSDEEHPEDDYPDDGFEPEPLNDHELQLIEQDLADLGEFESTFRPEGYRGVAVWCTDCTEEHYYPWDMLRENLTTLLETGETPVHEPAFAPEPDRYIPWDYARGYVDALRDAGVGDRIALDRCSRCGMELTDAVSSGNFCPRCGTPLLIDRLATVLRELGMDDDTARAVLRRIGITSVLLDLDED